MSEETNLLSTPIARRGFLVAGAGILTALIWRRGEAHPMPPGEMVKIVEFSDNGVRGKTITIEKMVKTEAEWKKQLSPASFYITRKEGTERPWTGELLEEHNKGVFRCICCDTALYDSATKFDSGTGWPSFWQPIAAENIVELKDTSLGMVRIAVACRRCDAHLGHVFDDGPKPTGLRYCMNSVAMRFAKST